MPYLALDSHQNVVVLSQLQRLHSAFCMLAYHTHERLMILELYLVDSIYLDILQHLRRRFQRIVQWHLTLTYSRLQLFGKRMEEE